MENTDDAWSPGAARRVIDRAVRGGDRPPLARGLRPLAAGDDHRDRRGISLGRPHSWIHLDVQSEKGTAERWTIEMDPASHLARRGWRSTTVKAGDEVSVRVYPLRNNEKGGQYISITLPNGRVMDDRER